MNYRTICTLLIGLASLGLSAAAQTPPSRGAQDLPPAARSPRSGGVVQGAVKDGTGGIIPGATITLTAQSGASQTTTTGGDGTYTFRGVAPGAYTVTSTYTGLQQLKTIPVNVAAGQSASANIVMTLRTQKQEVTVSETSDNTVSTEPSNNATALVLRKEDLDALPDDPDDLQADLQALAGPSAGPGGSQIFIDGFTGGRLPPKESIREIRINSNPFSAEFDKLGYGRIQIFTKPGSDKFHGQSYYNISDGIWNSRNPFLSVNPPFRTQLFGGNLSGPIGKHASFFVDVERRNIDDNGIVNATIPTADFLGFTSDQTFFPTPQRRTTVSPRVDYQLNSNNTLSFRYSYLLNDRPVSGIQAFNLPATTVGGVVFPSNGYSTSGTEHEFQMVETAVISPKVVNETHFQFERDYTNWASQSNAPGLTVSQSFVAGGSGYSAPGLGNTYDTENNFELQNYTSVTWGGHTTKFGIRVRTDTLENSSPRNFNGTYQFLGGEAFPYLGAGLQPGLTPTVQSDGTDTVKLSSIQQYLYTLQLLKTYSSATVTAMGYGPSQYSVSAGNPYISFYQMDFGPFVQDDWRVRPNLTMSFGVRWESQTNIADHSDFAPRVGFAWSPGVKAGSSGRAKTVIRGGWGMFYDRFGINSVETAYRYASANSSDILKTYTLDNPTIYDASFSSPIPLSALSGAALSSAQRYQIDSALQAPRLMETALGVERQLFGRTTLAVNFLNSRGVHELRTVDINAPIPTPGALPPGALQASVGGVRPFGNVGDIYNYESTGIFKQTQVLVNVNTQVGRWLTLFSRYSWGTAHSDTDGLSTLASNSYNFAPDWGRSSLDIAHTLFVGGSISAKWGLRFSPFIVARSGQPYNITTGSDLYLQGQGTPTSRPSVSPVASAEYNIASPFGFLDATPVVGSPLIERNIATGPGSFAFNLRVSKTWGFGTTKFSGQSGGARAGGGGGGGRGGPGGFGGGFGGGPRGGPGESTEHRFNLTLGINARNLLNHENLNTPNGAITSPYFLQSTGIAGGFGPEATASNQRRIDIQLRFAF